MGVLEQVASNKSFGGQQLRFKHRANSTQCEMHFSIYLPNGASATNKCPSIYWLSGLTCTDENFVQKAGAQQWANHYGVAVIAPDTSPRGSDVPDDPEGAWDFGLGAGFYVNATQAPWAQHYHMYNYVLTELPNLVEAEFPVTDIRSIMGHSMGGHGALTIALKNADRYASVSAFAPICNPVDCAWGKKAFSNYLGGETESWLAYDSCELVKKAQSKLPLLVDQGLDDAFLTEQLKPEQLKTVCQAHGHPLQLKLREGYDHSYFYIASFIEEHFAYHVKMQSAS